MKIAIVNNVVYAYATGGNTARGGAERFQWLLARALGSAGWTVVVGVRNTLAPGQVETVDGVRFVGMRPGHLVKSWWQFLSVEKPDWWFWRASDPLWPVLLMVAQWKGVRGIFSAAYDTDVVPRRALFRRQRLWPLYALGLRLVDRIFIQHSGQFADLAARLQPKARILPGLVIIPERVIARHDRGNYVAWVAVLRPHKRPDLLIQLARSTPELQYVVCGGPTTFGTPPEFTERILKELQSTGNIRYLGDVNQERTFEIIANAVALVSTSEMEGFPNTFLEAWSAGTPVVSLSVDPDQLIRKRGLGFVSGTPESAAPHLRQLMDSQDVFAAISHRARQYAEESHGEGPVVCEFNKAILHSESVTEAAGERQPE